MVFYWIKWWAIFFYIYYIFTGPKEKSEDKAHEICREYCFLQNKNNNKYYLNIIIIYIGVPIFNFVSAFWDSFHWIICLK